MCALDTDAGVVDEDIESAKSRDAVLDCGGYAVSVRDVCFDIGAVVGAMDRSKAFVRAFGGAQAVVEVVCLAC